MLISWIYLKRRATRMVYYHSQVQSFFCCWPHHSAYRILVSWYGKKTRTTALECRVLTTGLPGKSQDQGFFFLILEWTLQVIEGGSGLRIWQEKFSKNEKKKRKKDWKRTEQNIQKLWTITKDITYMLGITQRRRKKEMNRT